MGSVVFDLDGVIFDFEKAFCEKFGWERRWMFSLESRYPDKCIGIQYFVNSPRTYLNLDIIDLGTRILNFCRGEGKSIKIVSSRPYESVDATEVALERNKIHYNFLSVCDEWRSPKVKRIKQILDVEFVVEDNLNVAKELAELDIPVILIDQPWNQCKERLSGIIYRVDSFQEFLGVFTMFFENF